MIAVSVQTLEQAGIPVRRGLTPDASCILDTDETGDGIGCWVECLHGAGVEPVVRDSGISGWVSVKSDVGRRITALMHTLERENSPEMSVIRRVSVSESKTPD